MDQKEPTSFSEGADGELDAQARELLGIYADHCRARQGADTAQAGPAPAGFVAWCLQTLRAQGLDPGQTGIDDQVLDHLARLLPAGSAAASSLPVGRFSDEVLRHAVLAQAEAVPSRGLRHEEVPFTRRDVARLAARLLDVTATDVVADLCCGIGTFMVELHRAATPAGFFGSDLDRDAVMASRIRAALIGAPIEVRLADAFDTDRSFDRVFVDAPWGLRPEGAIGHRAEGTDDLAGLAELAETGRVTSEWLFALKALDCLATGGRAVVAMPTGALGGAAGAALRRQLVLAGKVAAVVALPRGAMAGTGAASCLVVLEQVREADTVTFVDAADLGSGRKAASLSDDAIAEVLRRLAAHAGAHAAVASVAEIGREGFSLVPARYTERVEYEGMVTLGSLATDITRGIGRVHLDERAVDEDTHIHYLEVRNLDEDGNVAGLAHLAAIEAREERYCASDGDVVLAKSLPFRSAVVRVRAGERVLCSGNLYIIRPDRDRVDPTYLKLFLDSPLGQAQLRRISSGTSVLTIPIRDLKDLRVPLVPMEEQKEIAAAYAELADELRRCRRRIERTRAMMGELFPLAGQR